MKIQVPLPAVRDVARVMRLSPKPVMRLPIEHRVRRENTEPAEIDAIQCIGHGDHRGDTGFTELDVIQRSVRPVEPPCSEAPPCPQTHSGEAAPRPIPNITVKDWHADEQPRERLMRLGPEALATSELLAILLRTGTTRHSVVDLGRQLLHHGNDRLRTLSQLTIPELAKLHGIGSVKAVTLKAALELGRRRATESDKERPLILGSRASYDELAPNLCDLPHEECWILLLNNASRLIAKERLSSGSLDGTIVDVRSVFACALRHNASHIVIAHNHPSGNLHPSPADIAITRRLAEAGDLMNIALDDHLIVGGRRYYSFRDAKALG